MSGQSTAQRAEIGHMGVALEPRDGRFEQLVVLAEDRAVGGEQVFDIAGEDSLEARDEVNQARAVVGVDHADAAVAEDVVAGKEQVSHPERELAGRMPGRAPDCRVLLPIVTRSPSLIIRSTLQRRHRDVDVLGVDPRVGKDLVSLFDGARRSWGARPPRT